MTIILTQFNLSVVKSILHAINTPVRNVYFNLFSLPYSDRLILWSYLLVFDSKP